VTVSGYQRIGTRNEAEQRTEWGEGLCEHGGNAAVRSIEQLGEKSASGSI